MNRRSAAAALLLVVTLVVTAGSARAANPIAPGSIVTESGRVLPPPPGPASPTIQAEMLADEAGVQMGFVPGTYPAVSLSGMGGIRTAAPSLAPDGTPLPNGLRKEIFGFLPYWMLNDTALASMNYGLVSTIAYFSVGATKDGALVTGTSSSPSTGWAGWTSSRMTNVINKAHVSGVRVVLTVTMMAWDSTSAANQATLLQTSANRAKLISAIVGAVRNRNADGVNLDFEPLATSLRASYVTFVKELKQALSTAGVGDYLTVSVMASAATWASGYDVAGLTAAGEADALFVMGYDYNWSGSSRAGGVAPIQSPYTIDVDGTMRDFLSETSGSKLIWGVPYYGRTWPTTSNQLNATTVGGGSHAYYYVGSLAQATQYGRLWDAAGQVPWYRHWDATAGNWVEGYYDDAQSLAVKYDLINARRLAGVGMWTLLMDQGKQELWRLLADKFVTDTAPPIGGVGNLPPVSDSEALHLAWNVIDLASGIDRFNVQVRPAGGGWTTWLTNTRVTDAWYPAAVGQTYEFRVQGIDLAGNAQPWTTVPTKPSSLTVNAFGVALADGLNVRTGAGLSYGAVSQLSAGEPVYALAGPVAADGYQWYQIQYDFGEWPTADFPHVGWAAAASGLVPYLAPANSPTVTLVDPFVTNLSTPAAFAPGGDGTDDTVTISFSLRAPASSVGVEILDDSGTRVRTWTLGAQAAGSVNTTWDGRLQDGTWAPPGAYLPRITATESGGADHHDPAAGFDAVMLARWGIMAFPDGTTIYNPPRALTFRAGTFTAYRFSAAGALITTKTYTLRHDSSASTTARRALPGQSGTWYYVANGVWSGYWVRQSPGVYLGGSAAPSSPGANAAFTPVARVSFRQGTHTGYRFDDQGVPTAARTLNLGSASSAHSSALRAIPNQYGRWFLIVDGYFAGYWVPASDVVYLGDGTTIYNPPRALTFRAGTFTAYRFSAAGALITTKTYTLRHDSSASTTARRALPGQSGTWYYVANGVWSGYWVRQSPGVYLGGSAAPSSPGANAAFTPVARVSFRQGTHTGYRFDDQGVPTAARTLNLGSASSAHSSALRAIPNQYGRWFLIVDGYFAGYWVPASDVVYLGSS